MALLPGAHVHPDDARRAQLGGAAERKGVLGTAVHVDAVRGPARRIEHG